MTELTRITYYSVQIKYLEVELANESKTRDLQWHRHQKKKLMSSDHMSFLPLLKIGRSTCSHGLAIEFFSITFSTE